MLLSIIIPVYNVEEYLESCLSAVFACSGFSYEVILVCRDSDDRSVDIAWDFVKAHINNTRIIEQEGVGLSNARNCGLKSAKGDYIVFFDSDDYISSDLFSDIMLKLDKLENMPDMLISDYRIIGKDGQASSVQNSIEDKGLIDDYTYLEVFLKRRRNYWNVWQYIYSTSFLRERELYFLEGVYSEDIEFSTRAILSAEKITFSHHPYYNYRIGREGSLANAVTLKHVRDLAKMLNLSLERIEKGSRAAINNLMANRMKKQYLLSLVMIYDVNIEDRKATVDCLSDNIYIAGINIKRSCICKSCIYICGFMLLIVRWIRRKVRGIH